MELNGVANMLLIIEMALEDKNINETVASSLIDQLDVLERYMCAIRKGQINGEPIPLWSTVRDNRHLYPNNQGKVKSNVHNES